MIVTVIGAGKMGEALARGMVRGGLLAPADIILSDVAGERVRALAVEMGAVAATDNVTAVHDADLVILAVKPYDVAAVCQEFAPALRGGATVLSIAAGITLTTLAQAIDRSDVVLARAMPNTPCLVGAGAIGVSFSAGAPDDVRATVGRLLSAVGLVVEVPERQLDAVTGLSGSGPAYIAVLIEALADGGVLVGLSRAQAQQLAAQTVLGTAKLILETGQHPAQVKDAVSSPGGTTIAGLAALEDSAFRAALIAAVRAATRRATELSGE